MDPLTAAYIGTAAYSAWNQYQAGRAGAEAHKQQEKAKRAQARKMMERVKMNAEFTRLEGETFKGSQIASFAGSGVDVGSGVTLTALSDTANKIERKIEVDKLTAMNQIDAILLDADLDIGRAEQSTQAGFMGAVSTMGSAAIRVSGS
jgi:hypothetical protein